MTTISAKVIADSIGEDAPRLTTLHLRYPRFIHSEVLRHRVFSGNARSSRAVPIAKLLEEVENDPVIPMHWGAAQAGMQAYAECENSVCVGYCHVDNKGVFSNPIIRPREATWLMARDQAVKFARAFMEAGYAKQLVNRILEPYLHIDHLVTATEWSNFFALRDHHAAEPHIQILARAIRKAMEESTPMGLADGQWHLPYVDQTADDYRGSHEGTNDVDMSRLRMISVARCARISYRPFDGETASVDSDIALADRLATSGHWSPFEHQATPDKATHWNPGQGWEAPHEHANFTGWRQFRRLEEFARQKAAA